VDESVLVIPATHLAAVAPFEGWCDAAAIDRELLDPAQFSFRPRSLVETDPTWKQLIPYCVLTHRGRIFTYTRGTGGGEKRLATKHSIGIGGHISEADARGGTDPYRTGMLRELSEEVSITPGWTDRMIGYVYDPSTPVGTVHLGIVHHIDLVDDRVVSREESIAEPRFADPFELLQLRERLETWSLLALEYLTTKR
jgi:predicted NUDIX family phosphoesterase